MKTFYVIVMASLLFQCGQKSSESTSGVIGSWAVDVPGGQYILSLADDSTLIETAFGNPGKWELVEGDSTQKSPARLTLYNEAGEGQAFDLIQVGDGIMQLAQSNRNVTLTRPKTDQPQPLDPFTKYTLLFNGSPYKALVPTPLATVQELTKIFVPEDGTLQPLQALIHSDTLFVGTVGNYASTTGIVFDVVTKKRLEFQELARGEGCSVGHEVIAGSNPPLIKQTMQCEESDVETTFFTLEKSGKLVKSTGEPAQEASGLNDLVLKLMTVVYKADFHKDSKDGNTLVFAGNDDYAVRGSYRNIGDLVYILVSESEPMAGSAQSGIFKQVNEQWVSQFSTELVPGKLDTLLDLNADGKLEIIIDVNKWNSAGANHEYILYAQTNSDRFEKMATIATSSEGYSVFQFDEGSKQVTSVLTYARSSNKIIIQVSETSRWTIDAATQKTGSEEASYSYSWDGKQLTKNK